MHTSDATCSSMISTLCRRDLGLQQRHVVRICDLCSKGGFFSRRFIGLVHELSPPHHEAIGPLVAWCRNHARQNSHHVALEVVTAISTSACSLSTSRPRSIVESPSCGVHSNSQSLEFKDRGGSTGHRCALDMERSKTACGLRWTMSGWHNREHVVCPEWRCALVDVERTRVDGEDVTERRVGDGGA